MADTSADSIIMRIGLTGADEVIASLTRMGEAGAEAFARIAEASERLNEGLEKSGGQVEAAGEKLHHTEGSLKELGETGNKTFERLTEGSARLVESLNSLSAQGAISGFQMLGSAIESATSHMGVFGQALTTVITTLGVVAVGTAAATFALYEFAKSASEAIISNHELAIAAGTTETELSGIKRAFADAGASTDQLAYGFRILGIAIANVWPEIRREVRDSADQIEGDQIKIRAAMIGVEGAADAQEATFNRLKEASLSLAQAQITEENSSLRVQQAQMRLADTQATLATRGLAARQAQLSVDQAQYNLDIARGAERDKDYEGYLKIEQAELALENAKKAQAEQARQAAREELQEKLAREQLALAYIQEQREAENLKKSKLELASAQREADQAADKTTLLHLQLREAQRKADDDLLKNVPEVAKALKGQSSAFGEMEGKLKTSDVSADTLFKAITLNATKAREEATKFGESVKAPTVKDELLEIADAFQHITDNTLKQNIARRALGRSATQEEIEALSKGRAYFEQHIQDQAKLGNNIIENIHKAEQFKIAFENLNLTLSGLKNALGVQFAPLFAEGLNSIREAIDKNKEQIKAAVADLQTRVRPIIEDIFRLITQGPSGLKTDFVKGIVAGFQGLIQALKVLYDLIMAMGGALKPLVEGLVSVGNAAGDATGGLLSLKNIIAGLILLQFGAWLVGVGRALGLLGLGARLARAGFAALTGVEAAEATVVGTAAAAGGGGAAGAAGAARVAAATAAATTAALAPSVAPLAAATTAATTATRAATTATEAAVAARTAARTTVEPVGASASDAIRARLAAEGAEGRLAAAWARVAAGDVVAGAGGGIAAARAAPATLAEGQALSDAALATRIRNARGRFAGHDPALITEGLEAQQQALTGRRPAVPPEARLAVGEAAPEVAARTTTTATAETITAVRAATTGAEAAAAAAASSNRLAAAMARVVGQAPAPSVQAAVPAVRAEVDAVDQAWRARVAGRAAPTLGPGEFGPAAQAGRLARVGSGLGAAALIELLMRAGEGAQLGLGAGEEAPGLLGYKLPLPPTGPPSVERAQNARELDRLQRRAGAEFTARGEAVPPEIQARITQLEQRIAALTTNIRDIKEGPGVTHEAGRTVRQDITAAQEKLVREEGTLAVAEAQFSEKLNQAAERGGLDEFMTANKQELDRLMKLTASIESLRTDIDASKDAVRQFERSTVTTAKAMVDFGSGLKNLTSGFDQAMGSVVGAMRSAGQQALQAVGLLPPGKMTEEEKRVAPVTSAAQMVKVPSAAGGETTVGIIRGRGEGEDTKVPFGAGISKVRNITVPSEGGGTREVQIISGGGGGGPRETTSPGVTPMRKTDDIDEWLANEKRKREETRKAAQQPAPGSYAEEQQEYIKKQLEEGVSRKALGLDSGDKDLEEQAQRMREERAAQAEKRGGEGEGDKATTQAAETIKKSGDEFHQTTTAAGEKFSTDVGKVTDALTSALSKFLGGGESPATRSGGSGGGTEVVPGQEHAAGGLIRGPGSGTSDSIHAQGPGGPIRVSSGEFIHKAAAVQHYGVGFMHALNNMKIPKFEMGGLLSGLSEPIVRATHSFAEGGPTGAGTKPRGLTLVLEGREYGGLSGPQHVVGALENYAVNKRLNMTGRPPSWKR